MSPRLVLGVTGSIAAYRAADIVSHLTKAGIEVDVVLSRDALKFVTPLTMQTMARRNVFTDETQDGIDGQPTHIALADRADLVLIAPATANVIGEYANGLAPSLLTSMLLATPAPVWFAPAMNGKMWQHPAVQENCAKLSKRGVIFIGPEKGLLACGYEGIGRLWSVEKICEMVLKKLTFESKTKIGREKKITKMRKKV
jgi:phosphopantothenoylcysteine decarboxylase